MAHSTLKDSQRVADLLLEKQGTTLRDWLTAKRKDGASYDVIGRELYIATDGEVSISYQTVRTWLIDFGLVEETAS